MSIFPAKILLATDGSEEAALAARTAAGMADRGGSELHVAYIRPGIAPHYPGYYVGPFVLEDAPKVLFGMLTAPFWWCANRSCKPAFLPVEAYRLFQIPRGHLPIHRCSR